MGKGKSQYEQGYARCYPLGISIFLLPNLHVLLNHIVGPGLHPGSQNGLLCLNLSSHPCGVELSDSNLIHNSALLEGEPRVTLNGR